MPMFAEIWIQKFAPQSVEVLFIHLLFAMKNSEEDVPMLKQETHAG